MMWISVNMLHNVCTTEWPKNEEGKKIELAYMACSYFLKDNFVIEGNYTDSNNKVVRYVASFSPVFIRLTINLQEPGSNFITKTIIIKADKKKIEITDWHTKKTTKIKMSKLLKWYFNYHHNTLIAYSLRKLITMRVLKKRANFESLSEDNKLTISDQEDPNLKVIISFTLPQDKSIYQVDISEVVINEVLIQSPDLPEIKVDISKMIVSLQPTCSRDEG